MDMLCLGEAVCVWGGWERWVVSLEGVPVRSVHHLILLIRGRGTQGGEGTQPYSLSSSAPLRAGTYLCTGQSKAERHMTHEAH